MVLVINAQKDVLIEVTHKVVSILPLRELLFEPILKYLLSYTSSADAMSNFNAAFSPAKYNSSIASE